MAKTIKGLKFAFRQSCRDCDHRNRDVKLKPSEMFYCKKKKADLIDFCKEKKVDLREMVCDDFTEVVPNYKAMSDEVTLLCINCDFKDVKKKIKDPSKCPECTERLYSMKYLRR